MGYNLYIDGPNGIGKTTLIRHLCGKYNLKYQHDGVPEILDRKTILLKYICDELFSTYSVFDRCWFGEIVYGRIYRGGNLLTYDDIDMMNEIVAEQQSKVIMFMPHIQTDTAAAAEILSIRAIERNEEHPLTPALNEMTAILAQYEDVVKNVQHSIYRPLVYRVNFASDKRKEIEKIVEALL